ncbi:MAG: hypothetical protein ACI93E_000282 [Flavobacteriales bacterium]|jgi:hypothetical protein
MESYTDRMGAYLSVDAPSSFDNGPLDLTLQVEADGFLKNELTGCWS